MICFICEAEKNCLIFHTDCCTVCTLCLGKMNEMICPKCELNFTNPSFRNYINIL